MICVVLCYDVIMEILCILWYLLLPSWPGHSCKREFINLVCVSEKETLKKTHFIFHKYIYISPDIGYYVTIPEALNLRDSICVSCEWEHRQTNASGNGLRMKISGSCKSVKMVARSFHVRQMILEEILVFTYFKDDLQQVFCR